MELCRRLWTVGLGGVIACSPNSGGAGGAGGATPTSEGADGGSGGGSGPPGSGVEPGPTTTGAGGSASSPSGPMPTDPPGDGSSEGPGGGLGDGPGGGSTSTGSDASTGDGGTTGQDPPPASQEVLGRADFANCAQPLWCFSDGDIMSPAGDGIWAQECFDVVMEPPFRLVELRAVIRGLSDAVDEVRLQVHERGVTGPGGMIADRLIDAKSLVLGENTITVDPPLVINSQTICVGLAAPLDGPAGALGVAVDPSSEEFSASYLRMNGQGFCNLLTWIDTIGLNPVPRGNWCMQATIEEQ